MMVSHSMREAMRWLRARGGVSLYAPFRREFPEHQTFRALVDKGLVVNIKPWSSRKRFKDRKAEVHLTDLGLGYIQGYPRVRLLEGRG